MAAQTGFFNMIAGLDDHMGSKCLTALLYPWHVAVVTFNTVSVMNAAGVGLGLRMLEGVDLEQFREEFGVTVQDAYPPVTACLKS